MLPIKRRKPVYTNIEVSYARGRGRAPVSCPRALFLPGKAAALRESIRPGVRPNRWLGRFATPLRLPLFDANQPFFLERFRDFILLIRDELLDLIHSGCRAARRRGTCGSIDKRGAAGFRWR